ncbi:hypothetical protein [Pyrodictium abyssi]|uniref:hypothetical protein n=1 Tax=Pyrodictium abyssi TaxID=54256 RepID=UPI0030C6ADFB
MVGASEVSKYINAVRRLWADLVPVIDEAEKRILYAYLKVQEASPYKISNMLGMNTATVYRKSRRLLRERLLISDGPRGRPRISNKGCLALYINSIIGEEALVGCFAKTWGVRVELDELLGFLMLLAIEAKRRKLNLKTMTMCRVDEASIHVLRFLKEAIMTYIRDGVSMASALSDTASRHGVPPRLFIAGIRLALRGISRTLPLTVHTDSCSIVILMHNRLLLPFVVECKRDCEYYRTSLGLDCPRAYRRLQRHCKLVTAAT